MADEAFAQTGERRGVLPVIAQLHQQHDGPDVAPPDMDWAERNLIPEGRRRFFSRVAGSAPKWKTYSAIRDWFRVDEIESRERATVWFTHAMTLEPRSRLFADSKSKPRLDDAMVTDARLLPLLDRSSHVIIKSIAVPTSITDDEYTAALDLADEREDGEFSLEELLIAFAWDVAHAMALRSLVTDYPLQVTPHFATLLDTVVAQDIRDPKAPLRVYSVMERADMTLAHYAKQFVRSYPMPGPQDFTRHISTLVFCTLRGLQCANRILGFRHGDLHWENVMVRDVMGTPYATRAWAYRDRDHRDDLQVIRAEDHFNAMIEIIDFDLSAMRPYSMRFADSVVDGEADKAFFVDALRFVTWGIRFFSDSRPRTADDRYDNMVGNLRNLMVRLSNRNWDWLEAPLFDGIVLRGLAAQQLADLAPLIVSWMPDSNKPTRTPTGASHKRLRASEEMDEEDAAEKRPRIIEACAFCASETPRYTEPSGRLYCNTVCQLGGHGFLDAVERRRLFF
jgi:hypothetical protein